jgi:hypothetical protein
MAEDGLLQAGLSLSFRIPVIVVFGLFLFATNLTVSGASGIPVERLIAPEAGASSSHSTLQSTRACYLLSLIFASILCVGLLAQQVIHSSLVPVASLAAILLILAAPARFRIIPFATERRRFFSQMARISVGGISTDEEGSRFLDILVADVLTSYARVFGDACVLAFSVLGMQQGSVLVNACIALAVSAPYWVRLRQCLILLSRTGEQNHLLNAIKYATAFPVIFLSALSATGIGQGKGDIIGGVSGSYISHGGLRIAWIAACVINSAYSLYWDICKDWDLFVHGEEGHVFRRQTHFPSFVYAVAIVVDTLLRFLWLAKFQPQSIVARWDYRFQYAEVLRRWMWLFLRIECEYARHSGTVRLPLAEVELDERGGVAFTRGRRISDGHAAPLLSGKVDKD